MIFYILWALTVGLAFFWAIYTARQRYDGWGSSWSLVGKGWAVIWRFVVAAACGPMAAAVVALMVAAIAASAGAGVVTQTKATTFQLTALANAGSVDGHFFLGTGSFNGKNVFNYVTDDGGYSTLRQADADASSIWQDESEHPHLDVTKVGVTVWWALPASLFGNDHYDFHIPDGSVYNGYEVKP